MDPNETLRRLRACANEDDPFVPAELLTNMQELFGALDEWLSRGGFLPDAWVPPLGQRLARGWRLSDHEPLGPPNPADGELP